MKRALLDELLEWKSSTRRKPMILRGARQVGKTWLLKEFGKSFQHCHHINFEKEKQFHSAFTDSLNPLEIIKNLSLLIKTNIDIQNDIIIFDEVQECPIAISSLKYFNEDLSEMAICAAGSHIGVTFSEASYPVGKVTNLNLYPLSFQEFLQNKSPELIESYNSYSINETEHLLLWKQFIHYLYCGGMPENVDIFTDDLDAISHVSAQQSSLIESYIADFSKHAGKVNASHIATIYENIPQQLQAVYDNSTSRYKFKGVLPNRSKYSQLSGPINWLIHTGLILKVSNVNSPKIPLKSQHKENMFKLLYADIGLLTRALDLDYQTIKQQDYGSYKGFIAENFVGQELKSSNETLAYWKRSDSSSSAEIEFVIEHATGIVPIEVKSGLKNAKSKSLSAYKNKYSPPVSVKLSGQNLRFENKHINAPIYLAGRIHDLIDYASK